MQTIQIDYFYTIFLLQLLFLLLNSISLNKIYGQNIVRFIRNPKHNRYKI
jgi:hypothetical protein